MVLKDMKCSWVFSAPICKVVQVGDIQSFGGPVSGLVVGKLPSILAASEADYYSIYLRIWVFPK